MFGKCKKGGCLERYLLGKMLQEVLYKGKKLKIEKSKWKIEDKGDHFELSFLGE